MNCNTSTLSIASTCECVLAGSLLSQTLEVGEVTVVMRFEFPYYKPVFYQNDFETVILRSNSYTLAQGFTIKSLFQWSLLA